MTDREGPRAHIILGCTGCKNYTAEKHDFLSTGHCAKRDGIIYWASTPDWCPKHPGQVVAVVVPSKFTDDDIAMQAINNASEMRGWNACLDALHASVRKLGQSVEGE